MENNVAIKVVDKKRGTVAFLTWGRVFGAVEMVPLLQAVEKSFPKFGLRDAKSAKVCNSLREVAMHEYFYEKLVAMAWKSIPFGKKSYPLWAAKARRAISQGKELYYLSCRR